MKFKPTALFPLFAACLLVGSSGCSLFRHHQPKSSFKIIDEGDNNPFIIDSPTRAGTQTRTVELEGGQKVPGR